MCPTLYTYVNDLTYAGRQKIRAHSSHKKGMRSQNTLLGLLPGLHKDRHARRHRTLFNGVESYSYGTVDPEEIIGTSQLNSLRALYLYAPAFAAERRCR